MGYAPRARYLPAPLSQHVLFFVTEEERTLQDELYKGLLDAARERKPRSEGRPSKVPEIRIELLDGPLFAAAVNEACETDPLVSADALDESDGETYTESDLQQKTLDVEYMASDPYAFLEWLMLRNLSFLHTRGNPVEKKSVIEWMFAPDVDGHVYDFRNGKGKKIPLISKHLPFSFEWICIQLGACSRTLRAGVIRELTKLQASSGLKKSATIGNAVLLAKSMESQ